MTDLPEPLTPADCDLRGLPFMPLDVTRLLDSDFFALSTPAEFKAGVALWCKSWLQVPAASLPDDDRILAHLSGAGTSWRKMKAGAMRGWKLCSDGRWYHPTVAEKANDAWKHRLSQRAKIAKRWNRGTDDNGCSGNAVEDTTVSTPVIQGTGRGTVKVREEGESSSPLVPEPARAPDDDDDDAIDPVSIANALCRQAGVSVSSPKAVATAAQLVREWQQAGATPDLMRSTVADALPRAAEPISSLRYFDKPIRHAIALEANGHGNTLGRSRQPGASDAPPGGELGRMAAAVAAVRAERMARAR